MTRIFHRVVHHFRPPPPVAREIDAEFDFHLQSRIDDFLASGLSLREARAEALRRFGPSGEFRRECIAAWHSPDPPRKGDSFMKNFLHDLRYALRMLRRSPGFTLVALITLALAIGANTAIFSVVNGVLLRPLPYPEPERLTVIWERTPSIETMSIAYPNYADWRAQNTVFDNLAIFRRASYNLTGSGDAIRIPGAQVSANLFNTVAVQPALGRAFAPEEDNPGAPGVVILSHGLWENHFGANRNILGSSITLNGQPYSIIGVMPRTFAYPSRVQLWVPIGPVFAVSQNWHNRGNHPGIFGIARLKQGQSLAQAQANMDTISAALGKQFPNSNANSSVVLTSLRELLVSNIRPALYVLFAAVLFVLLIACANLANLQLSRAAARNRELAIRSALGAGRSGLIRLLLAESLVLSFVGGALGYLLGRWGLDAILAAVPKSLPAAAATGMDHWVLLFTLGVSVFTGILFGLAPALHFSRADVSEDLKEGSRGNSGSRTHRLRSLLVVSEVALAMILLVGAGLLTQSFLRLSAVNPGFNPDGVLTAQVSLPAARYPARPDNIRFFDQAIPRIQSLPGVEAAAMTDNLPFAGGSQTSFGISGRPLPPTGQDRHLAEYFDVSPDYFRAMGISLIRGRTFTEADGRNDAPAVVIIDEAFARTHYPEQDPIGQHLFIELQDTPANRIEIIGVVSTVRVAGLAAEPRFVQMYFPYTQTNPSYGALILRTSGEPAALAPAVRAAIQSLDKDLPVYSVLPMSELVDSSIANWRLNMLLISIFSTVAVILAAVGIYGVMSFQVAQRTQEVGIRMALGAQQSSILRLMVGRGALLAAIGLAIGVAGAYGLTRFLTNMLFNIKPTDALTYISVAALLAFVALLACFLPARRAAKLDPLTALRYE